MRRNICMLLAALFAAVILQSCNTEKYKQVKCKSVDIESFLPVSPQAFEAVLALELENPAPSFRIKDLHAVLKRSGEGLLSITADPLKLKGKCTETYKVPLHGELLQEVSALQLLSLFHHFNPEDFTVDVTARANVFGSIGKDVVYKDMPIMKLMEK